jgi:hypothetical protein
MMQSIQSYVLFRVVSWICIYKGFHVVRGLINWRRARSHCIILPCVVNRNQKNRFTLAIKIQVLWRIIAKRTEILANFGHPDGFIAKSSVTTKCRT